MKNLEQLKEIKETFYFSTCRMKFNLTNYFKDVTSKNNIKNI